MAKSGSESLGKVNTSEELLDELQKRYKEARDSRLYLEAQWYKNMAFYMGKQWVDFDKTNRKLVDFGDSPSWRVRHVTNYVINLVQTKTAMLMKNKPIWNVMSMTDDTTDREGAKLSQQFLDYLWRKEDVLNETKKLIHYGTIFGSGFIKTYWDIESGPRIEDPNSTEKVSLGEIQVSSVSPFEIFADPYSKSPSINDCRWLIHAYKVSPEEAKERYQMDFKTETTTTEDVTLEKQFQNLIHGSGYVDGVNNTTHLDDKEFVTIKEYWENPNPINPDGRYCIFTDTKVVYEGPLPYGMDVMPFSKYDDIFVPDRFYGMSVVEQVIPLQVEYNKTRSQILENRNLMANPKWVAPKDSITDKEQINSEPGEIIWYNAVQGISPPQPMAMPSPPAYLFAQEQRILNDIEIVSGISDVTMRSGSPTGVESGRALALLAEKDESRMTTTIQSFEAALSKVGKDCIQLAKIFYDESRAVRIAGSDNVARVVYLKGANLSSPEDIAVTIGQGLGFSRLARVELLLEMWDRGLMRDPQKLLHLMEFGDDKGVNEEQNMDRNNASVENLMMSQGQPAQPMPWEDHMIHLEVHRKYIKSDDFKQLDPQAQQLMFEHYMATNEIVQQQMADLAEQQKTAE
tara:strand:- start:135 stop:2021 length:1887 start_codon:yes stop_codon:yes gene_type:complete